MASAFGPFYLASGAILSTHTTLARFRNQPPSTRVFTPTHTNTYYWPQPTQHFIFQINFSLTP
jgi:hypothetical protein